MLDHNRHDLVQHIASRESSELSIRVVGGSNLDLRDWERS